MNLTRMLGPLGLFLVSLHTVQPVSARQLSPSDVHHVDKLVEAALAKSGAPSASVAIVRNGEITFLKAYGRRSVEPNHPASISARYKIGTASKQMTAMAVLLLVQDGRLSLDDKVAKWLPELTDADRITVRQLLSHTAGYPGYFTSDIIPVDGLRPIAPQMIAGRLGRQPLESPPGAEWRYSNTNYVIAGLIVEKVSGKRLNDFIRQRIFQPLKMTSAANLFAQRMPAKDAQAYSRFVLGPPRPTPVPGSGWEFGAGDWSMTAQDLAKWDVAVIRRRLMPASAYAVQQKPVVLTDGTTAPFGLGIFVDSVAGHRRLHYPGSDWGFFAENRIYPDDRSAVVVMVNADYGNAQNEIAAGVELLLIPQPAVAKSQPSASPQSIDDGTRPDEIAFAHSLYDQLRRGKLDHTLLMPDANVYFTPTAVKDYRDSLTRLGNPQSFTRSSSRNSGDLHSTRFVLIWPHRTLMMTIRTTPQGKIAALTIIPTN